MSNELQSRNALDVEAMASTAQGDLEAFCGIVRRNQNALLNFFRRLGAHHHRAEDLVQETFLRLYQWRLRYRPSARFATFLFTLARHVWVDDLRKQKRTVRTVTEEGRLPAIATKGQGSAVERRLDIQAALQRLSEKLRSVVVLNVYHGLNYREIGEVLEIPEGTVKSRMFQALRQLRPHLALDDAEDADDE